MTGHLFNVGNMIIYFKISYLNRYQSVHISLLTSYLITEEYCLVEYDLVLQLFGKAKTRLFNKDFIFFSLLY